MNKKQIIILIIVGLVIFIATFFGVYLQLTNDDGKPKETKKAVDNAIILKDYKVTYGTYVGVEKEYNDKTQAITSKNVKMNVSKDSINGEKYVVKDNSIYVNGYELYKVTNNDELKLLAGSGIEYKLDR